MEREGEYSYNLLMAKNLYGRLMLKLKKEEEAMKHLRDSENLAKQIPFWWNHLEHLYIDDFDLNWIII